MKPLHRALVGCAALAGLAACSSSLAVRQESFRTPPPAEVDERVPVEERAPVEQEGGPKTPFGVRGRFDVMFGVQDADDSDLDGVGLDEPIGAELRLGVELVPEGWLAIDLGLGGGVDESNGNVTVLGNTTNAEVDGTYSELTLGLTLQPTFAIRPDSFGLQPYVGAGVALINVDGSFDLGVGDLVDDDSTIGFYLRYGLAAQFENGLRLGAEYRAVQAEEVELFNREFDFDYDRIAGFIGFRF
ncbi:MAG: outer membrane beta-barrel protein [Planctomycetota bacterium]